MSPSRTCRTCVPWCLSSRSRAGLGRAGLHRLSKCSGGNGLGRARSRLRPVPGEVGRAGPPCLVLPPGRTPVFQSSTSHACCRRRALARGLTGSQFLSWDSSLSMSTHRTPGRRRRTLATSSPRPSCATSCPRLASMGSTEVRGGPSQGVTRSGGQGVGGVPSQSPRSGGGGWWVVGEAR